MVARLRDTDLTKTPQAETNIRMGKKGDRSIAVFTLKARLQVFTNKAYLAP